MKKIISILAMTILFGCNSSGGDESIVTHPNSEVTNTETNFPEKILVSGQSNAIQCDWSYLENITGSTVVNISSSGKTIEQLIDILYDDQPVSEIYDTMIFVHGERDALLGTDLDEYISGVDEYQNALGVNKIIFSLVGRREQTKYDESYDALRNKVKEEVGYRESWHVGFYNAYTFRERDMLKDSVHFTEEGCQEMMNSIINKAPYE